MFSIASQRNISPRFLNARRQIPERDTLPMRTIYGFQGRATPKPAIFARPHA